MIKALLIIFLLIIFFLPPTLLHAQIFCKPNGNVVIYSNYDGGYLNINVDQDIPNLKIGVTTYEDCEITISGTYASNVTQVIYAGYQGDNQHCNPSPLTTSVNGVDPGMVTINLYPDAVWPNPNGYLYIICNYQCDSTGYQGGCNTPDQIAYYYLTEFGGSLYYHFTQYGCWSGTYNVSSGGNCCIGENLIPPANYITAGFTASDDTVCVKEGIIFTNTTTEDYPGDPTYNWDFGDGTFATTQNGSHGYTTPGEYTITLTATDSSGTVSDTETMIITVIDCTATGVADQQSGNDFMVFPTPAHEMIYIQVPPDNLSGRIELLDASGRILLSRTYNNEENIAINTSSIAAGLYCLRIVNDHAYVFKKVVIE